jgi:hypothetical protein
MSRLAALVAEGWTQAEIDRLRRVEAGGSVVANVGGQDDRHLVAWAESMGKFVYVGRGGFQIRYRRSDWHNPAVLAGMDRRNPTLRARVLASYDAHLDARPDLLARLEGDELRGKVLGCHCYPLGCHGGILVERLEAAAARAKEPGGKG